MNHLVEVALLLSAVGEVRNLDTLIAAILHDIVEDTATTLDEVSERFGSRVCELVDALSDEKSLPKAERKRLVLEHLVCADESVKIIKLADLCSNIGSVPIEWPSDRVRDYLEWSRQAAALCAGVNPALDELFLRRWRAARENADQPQRTVASTGTQPTVQGDQRPSTCGGPELRTLGIEPAMNPKLVSTSKFLSLILRHKPDEIGLVLDANGWANIDELIHLANMRGNPLNRSTIEEVVAANEKRRFVLSEAGTKIRAAQGHSVSVDLGLSPRKPPATLFHGTATRFVEGIRKHGLQPATRLYVHLSADETAATSVGRRHGTPVVLRIEAGTMYEHGHSFFLSENEVWLTKHVPPQFIRFPI